MKGVQLAINQVVILIIAIVIFSLGIALMFKIFAVSEQQLPGVNEQIEQQLDRALKGGKVVEIPTSTKTTSANDMATFYLGIKNDPAAATNDNFEVMISFNSAVNANGEEICEDCSPNSIIIPNFELIEVTLRSNPIEIPDNEVKVIGFGVIPNRVSEDYDGPGQYVYNVCVCDDVCTSTECTPSEFATEQNPYGFETFSVIVR